MPVHLAHQMADMDALMAIASAHFRHDLCLPC